MAEPARLRPWWERHTGWWEEQRRALELEWGRGRGFAVDEEAHTIRWEGSVRVQIKGRRKKVPVTIQWGPATPQFPPSISSSRCHSVVHQHNEGSMCLLPPVDPVLGWEGPLDIGYWLGKAEEWLQRFFAEDWGIPKDTWDSLRPSLPGYRYRRSLSPTQIVALPAEWRDLGVGCGRVRVRLPANGKGIGAVIAWEDNDGRWTEWPPSEHLVPGLVDEVEGIWFRADRVPTNLEEGWFSDLAMNQRHTAIDIAGWARAAKQERDRVQLISYPQEAGEHAPGVWLYNRRMRPGLVLEPDPALQVLGLIGLPKDGGIGVPLHDRLLDARRRAGRAEVMHEAISQVRVVIVGLGSLGSEVAHLLAQEGVRSFTLIDGDIFLPGNESRHRAGLTQAGRSKVEIMAGMIRGIQPEADVEVVQEWLDDHAPSFVVAGQPTLVVGASGDEATEHFLADLCHELEVPVVHAWVEVDGQVVRVCRAIPDLDPTLSEVSMLEATPRVAMLQQETGPTECAEAVLPGSALNMHAAANFVVRVALDVITGRITDANHWLFAPEGLEDADQELGLGAPYSVYSTRLDTR